MQGNFIGTNAAGTAAIQNFGEGAITIDTAADNLVGGTTVAARNLISGNFGSGVFVHAPSDSARPVRNRIQGNFIGTKIDGTTALGNGLAGVYLATSRNNDVGGSDPGAGNTIQFNKGNGVNVNLDAGPANSILGNSIDKNNDDVEVPNNHELGINLALEDVTLNDAGDTDTSANDIQNFPESTAPAQAGGDDDDVFGVLHSNPNEAFRVEVFASPNCDRSGYGEGARYIGSVDVTTNASGVTVIKSPGESDRAVFPVHVDVDVEHAITMTTNRHGR